MKGEPLYPEITVTLIGEDGNAFAIMGRVQAALEGADVDKETVERFFAEATSGDYTHMLDTVERYVTID